MKAIKLEKKTLPTSFRFFCLFFSEETSNISAKIFPYLKSGFLEVHENVYVDNFGVAEVTLSNSFKKPKGTEN